MFDSYSNHLQNNFPIEGLKLITTCPICNKQYGPVAAKIVDEKEGAHLVHIQCSHCNSSIVAVVLVGGLGVSTVGLLCDLTSNDVYKFRDSQKVGTDDIIEIHQILQKDQLIKYLEE